MSLLFVINKFIFITIVKIIHCHTLMSFLVLLNWSYINIIALPLSPIEICNYM